MQLLRKPDGSSLRIEEVDEPADTPETERGGTDHTDTDTADRPDAEAIPTDSSQEARTSWFEVYQDRAEEWRWRLVHWNGNIIADSGEGYTSKSNAKRAANGVMQAAPAATIDERDS